MRQCKACPWKTSTNPLTDIPTYDLEKHKALRKTIASFPLEFVGRGELRIMTCHETEATPCVGWLVNQLGVGNNIALRLQQLRSIEPLEIDGEQHPCFEDTLP